MKLRRLAELVRKDLRLFLRDRQAVVLSLLVPVMIASILGWMDVSSSSGEQRIALSIAVVDEDQSPVSRAIVGRLEKDGTVKPIQATREVARQMVADGSIPAALVLLKGFSQSAGKPKIELIDDPSHPMEAQVVKGAVMEAASAEVAKSTYGALAGDGTAPVQVEEQPAAATQSATKWAAAAHDFAGFGMQGLLFFAMEAAVGLARERRLGMWQRLKSSPMPLNWVLLARGLSSSLVAFAIIVAMFGLGAALFGIRILGSFAGFGAICLATALLAASFGLLMATLCRTEAQSRGVAFLVIMVMLAAGGAWFPMAKMPAFVQSLSNWMPVRWAVDGFDAMTWRGESLANGLHTAGVIVLFALAFSIVSALKFRRAAYTI